MRLSEKLVVCSPNIKSNALKELADRLSAKVGYRVWRVTPENVRGRKAVRFMAGVDKIAQFQAFSRANVSAPSFALSLTDARNLPSKQVVVRALTAASEGAGISIVDKEELTQNAPLYTEYIPKKKEFRVHVWDGKVIDTQEKRRRTGAEGSTQVRNTANGYVFCRNDIVLPRGIHELALSAVAALGRTYGGVDIIYNEHRDQCYVLEVNSRPGLEGTTVDKYVEAIVG